MNIRINLHCLRFGNVLLEVKSKHKQKKEKKKKIELLSTSKFGTVEPYPHDGQWQPHVGPWPAPPVEPCPGHGYPPALSRLHFVCPWHRAAESPADPLDFGQGRCPGREGKPWRVCRSREKLWTWPAVVAPREARRYCKLQNSLGFYFESGGLELEKKPSTALTILPDSV